MFAIHDENILEYVHNIIARGSHAPIKFFSELQQRNLLLIGCTAKDQVWNQENKHNNRY